MLACWRSQYSEEARGHCDDEGGLKCHCPFEHGHFGADGGQVGLGGKSAGAAAGGGA